MKDGICPKCGSNEVFKKLAGGYIVIPLQLFRASIPINYICANCGYIEWYIEKHDDLDIIRSKWESANPNRKRKNDE